MANTYLLLVVFLSMALVFNPNCRISLIGQIVVDCDTLIASFLSDASITVVAIRVVEDLSDLCFQPGVFVSSV